MAVAALIHQKFPLDKAPPQPPFQTHFCGMYLEQLTSRKITPLEFFFCCCVVCFCCCVWGVFCIVFICGCLFGFVCCC